MATQFLETTTPVVITTQTTTVIATAGKNVYVHTITVLKDLAGTATFRDKGTPTNYFILPIGTKAGCAIVDWRSNNGLEIVTSAADFLLITYQL